jgi:sugar phosphate isomerase/epimerase
MNRRTFMQQVGLSAPLLLSRAGAAKAPVLGLSQLTSSTASLSGFSFEDALKQIRALGFDGVEILTFTGATHSVGPIPGVVVADLAKVEKRRLRSIVEKFRSVSTHLPFHGMRPLSADPGIRKAAMARIHQAIDDSAFWGATVAVLHHVGGAVDTGHTRSYRADIGVGDSDRGTPQAAKRYNDVMMQKVEGLGSKLFHFHVHDVRPADWREHRTLGTGLVDWQRLLGYLGRTGYKGMFAIELEEAPPVEHLRRSREVFDEWLRKLS